MKSGGDDAPLALVLGESGAGKTHYVIQLLGRLNQQAGRFGIRGAAPDLSPLEDAVRRLNRGLTAAHTPSGEYREIVLPLTDSETGDSMDILWPDYAGEQVSRIVSDRVIPAAWRERLLAADSWLLLVRLQHFHDAEDVLSRPLGSVVEGIALAPSGANAVDGTAPVGDSARWLDQARLVELLQFLLYARNQGLRDAVTSPQLVVLLTCWDEITGVVIEHGGDHGESGGSTTRPDAVLAERAPLLAQFIDANWAAEAHAVLGLSALQRVLSPDRPDQEFAEIGPEAFGYVVREDGTVTPDLTWPLGALFSRPGTSLSAARSAP